MNKRISNISKLKDFLLQHRKDYVNAGSERDQIDQDAQIFMRTCADAISQLRSEMHVCVCVCSVVGKQVVSAQVKDHRAAVLDLIEAYLKGVCKLYSEQRAVRVKRVVDKKRLQIEGKVVEISRLQEIFAEKVLQQETEIDNIHQLVVGATENVKEGNEDIRENNNLLQ
ncbi:syntaxin-18 [Labeo rohita]|uniref:Syntaxin-18 n=1 Tax=Labeo rohita TaxID=84645 RepID=A0A498MMS5_LABRO|nr:syntaxin-18 [Labeo rohita]